MANYRLTARAMADRDAIARQGLREWGKRQVEDYLDDLQTRFERLSDYPELGKAADDVRPGYRILTVGAHHVYYRVEEDAIVIVRIRPQRMEARAQMLHEGKPS